ncbi:hypothetical protein DXM27_10375 [Rhizobium rhizogenes]|uniref:Uncharacterized protein n=1 Tax=Rhizobium rhizogenes TaxID=359 RepID=A0AA88JRZ7_RHIRH|nr:hypothetical protein [Rhizobium rhizogenes]KAA3503254.1 hypothetical protein DXM27_10375 [Rhizobium rhizogenes]
MKMRASDRHSKAIIKDDGEIIGFALELANGRWAPFGEDSTTRLVEIGISFEKPRDVLNFFKASKAGKGGVDG